MRGRRPAGPEYVKQVPGSESAKQRALLILQTIAGDLRLSQACEVLDICPQRFDQLRAEALAALVASLEPGTPGRPPSTPAFRVQRASTRPSSCSASRAPGS